MVGRFLIAIMMVLGMLFAFGGCGQSETELSRTDGDKIDDASANNSEVFATEDIERWIIDEVDLPDADEVIAEMLPQNAKVLTEQWKFINGTIYRVVYLVNTDSEASVSERFKGCCIQKMESPYREWVSCFLGPEDWVIGEICYPWNYRIAETTEEGHLIFLLEGQQSSYFADWTEDGVTVSKIEGELISREIYKDEYLGWWRSKNGDFYFYGYQDLIHIDDDFKLLDRLSIEEGDYICAIAENNYDNGLYLIEPTEFEYGENMTEHGISQWIRSKGMKILSADGKVTLWETEDIFAGGSEKLFFTSETEGYLYQPFLVAEFSFDGGESNILYDFSNDGYYFNRMSGIVGGYVQEDNSHILLVESKTGDYQIWVMQKDSKQSTTQQKQLLECAMSGSNGYMEQAVVAFNKQSDDYTIVLREPSDGETYDDFRTEIQAELSAGNGPALLMEGVLDVETGAPKGFLKDLTAYFAAYEDDMLHSAWKLGIVDGHRYAVPFSCSVSTVVTDKRLVENQESWTMQEAMRYMEKSNADAFMACQQATELFYYLGLNTGTNKQLVDWERGVSYLNSDVAVELLDFSAKYADYKSTRDNQYVRVAEGNTMTSIIYLMNTDVMHLVTAMFQGNEAYIGFPVEDGRSGHLMNGYSLAVNHACSDAELEGAIEFIKYLLSDEVQKDIAGKVVKGEILGFPVKSSGMEFVYDYLQSDEIVMTERTEVQGGLEYSIAPLADESIRKLRDIFETARPVANYTERLYSIVEGEMDGYSNGSKSTKQVLDIVQNRAQLYLDENFF